MSPLTNAHALIVGIANYRAVNRLPTTVLNDARGVNELLIDPQRGSYDAANVQCLLDDDATLTALHGGLARLAQRCDADSTAFVYFSGHGARLDSDPAAGEYLLPVDVSLASAQTMAATALSDREFTEALQRIRARKVLVIFDCCHAGGIGQAKDVQGPALKAGLSEGYYQALGSGRGRVILASSRDNEFSYVLQGAANSLFTHHLLAGLQGGIASDDGLIRVFDLFEYVQPRVTADHPQQHPVFKAELEENFPVALRLGGQTNAVAKDGDGFRYDAYVSYSDRDPDATWVWQTLVPKLEQAGLRAAVSGDVEVPGVARVVGIERGIRQAKRTVLILSEAYLNDQMATFENTLAQTMGLQEGTYRLLPIKIGQFDETKLPTRLSMLTTLDLTNPSRATREFDRLIRALQGSLPTSSLL
ncbi:MAG: caspase family protein [Caldilineaceae bacterium]|nr:caspase family protein [Caldilineaceae bacterium]MCB0206817.1 caspase family protein [Anaerolineae bacterium]